MRIAVLSGADKNAGDFLIVRRSRMLLEALVPGCELVEFQRNRPLGSRLDELNSCDCVVFAGGPGYSPDMYPGVFPLVADLDDIEPPMFALGMGCFAPAGDIGDIRFSDSSRRLLDRLEADGFGLGCRDLLTKRLLEANGYDGAVFTGCPAWYDLDMVERAELAEAPAADGVRRIAISDPALPRDLDAPKHLVTALRAVFHDCEIQLVFHRGWSCDKFSSSALSKRQRALAAWARDNGVEPVDISYGADGFSTYDECDLHVGYRVHAHLYNVSRRKPSYLIEEDGRGFGANEALSQAHVQLASPHKLARAAYTVLDRTGAAKLVPNRRLRATAIEMAEHVAADVAAGYPACTRACLHAHDAYGSMRAHIGQLNAIGRAGHKGNSIGEREKRRTCK